MLELKETTAAETATDTGNLARQWDNAHVMRTYARQPVEFVRGEGSLLYDRDGKEYIDWLAGIAVCSVGHSHPYLTKALQEQAATLLHVSNIFLTAPQAKLARRLVELSDMERVFFANSGAEANEAAIKIARKLGRSSGNDRKTKIVSALRSFHGRTLATVTAGGQSKYSEPFAPLPADFVHVPFNDVDALTESVDKNTCAILLEPILGEGGIYAADWAYLKAARDLADKYDSLLIFDEVQTGVGRTGRMWAYQRYGIVPDVMTLAKGLGGGIPIGACLARGLAAETFVPGDHGSTFAGNPFAATAANAVLDIIADERLLHNVRTMGTRLRDGLEAIRQTMPEMVGTTRGMGLMVGLELKKPVAKTVVTESLKCGLVINAPNDETIRILPPLTITEKEIDTALARLEDAIIAANRV